MMKFEISPVNAVFAIGGGIQNIKDIALGKKLGIFIDTTLNYAFIKNKLQESTDNKAYLVQGGQEVDITDYVKELADG